MVFRRAGLERLLKIGLEPFVAKLEVVMALDQQMVGFFEIAGANQQVEISHRAAAEAGMQPSRDASILQRNHGDVVFPEERRQGVEFVHVGGHAVFDLLVRRTPALVARLGRICHVMSQRASGFVPSRKIEGRIFSEQLA